MTALSNVIRNMYSQLNTIGFYIPTQSVTNALICIVSVVLGNFFEQTLNAWIYGKHFYNTCKIIPLQTIWPVAKVCDS